MKTNMLQIGFQLREKIRKREKDYKRTGPKEKHKKIKEKREPGKVGSHKRQ